MFGMSDPNPAEDPLIALLGPNCDGPWSDVTVQYVRVEINCVVCIDVELQRG